MGTTAIGVDSAPPPRTATGSVVWERQWLHVHSDEKDDRLLAREEQGHRWAAIVERLERAFGRVEGLRTIELGSGRGDLSALLAKSGADPLLLDASEAALKQARHRFERLGRSAVFCQGDMLAPEPALRNTFDVALSSGVIEHFKGAERPRVVRAHLDVLRPGGMVIISVPNARCVPYRIWKKYLELRGWWPYGMEIPYTKRELRRRAAAAGFESVEPLCVGFWQSVSAHWGRGLLRRDVDWSHRRSRLDSTMGFTLLLFGRRPAEGGERGSSP